MHVCQTRTKASIQLSIPCNCNVMYSSYCAIPKRNALALRSSSIDPVAPESDQSALPVLRLKVTSPARSSNLQIDSNGNGAASHVVSCLHTVIPKPASRLALALTRRFEAACTLWSDRSIKLRSLSFRRNCWRSPCPKQSTQYILKRSVIGTIARSPDSR